MWTFGKAGGNKTRRNYGNRRLIQFLLCRPSSKDDRSPSPEQAAERLSHIKEEIERAGVVSAELEDARRKAEAAVRLARYYRDAVELSRRLTQWSKSLTGNRDFIICSGGSGGMMEAA